MSRRGHNTDGGPRFEAVPQRRIWVSLGGPTLDRTTRQDISKNSNVTPEEFPENNKNPARALQALSRNNTKHHGRSRLWETPSSPVIAFIQTSMNRATVAGLGQTLRTGRLLGGGLSFHAVPRLCTSSLAHGAARRNQVSLRA